MLNILVITYLCINNLNLLCFHKFLFSYILFLDVVNEKSQETITNPIKSSKTDEDPFGSAPFPYKS